MGRRWGELRSQLGWRYGRCCAPALKPRASELVRVLPSRGSSSEKRLERATALFWWSPTSEAWEDADERGC